MDITKTILLVSVTIIAFAVSLTVTQLFIKKEKTISENEGKLKLSFAVYISTWVILFSILNLKMIGLVEEFIDSLYKINTNKNPLMEAIKTSAIMISITNVWLVLWYYAGHVFSLILMGKRKPLNELENDNYSYFIIKGIVIISFMSLLMPFFEKLLRMFLPQIEIPFYH